MRYKWVVPQEPQRIIKEDPTNLNLAYGNLGAGKQFFGRGTWPWVYKMLN